MRRTAAATLTPKPTPLTLGGGLVKTIEVYSTILGSGWTTATTSTTPKPAVFLSTLALGTIWRS